MAMTQTTPQTHTFTDENDLVVKATFNGKIYNGKRYINYQYRLNNTKSGLKSHTAIWEDGFGWVECRSYNNTLIRLFGLE